MARDDPKNWGYDGKPRVPRHHQPHFVYVIAADSVDIIKVGYAHDPEVRRNYIQAGNPAHLSIKSLIKCRDIWAARDLERAFHREHAKHFVRGEWFNVHHLDAEKWLKRASRAQSRMIKYDQ